MASMNKKEEHPAPVIPICLSQPEPQEAEPVQES